MFSYILFLCIHTQYRKYLEKGKISYVKEKEKTLR